MLDQIFIAPGPDEPHPILKEGLSNLNLLHVINPENLNIVNEDNEHFL
jgi:hypothetical protein